MKSIFKISLFLLPLCLLGQRKALSEYLISSHSKAFYDAITSDVDTLVVDDISEPWVFEPITLRGIKNKVVYFEPGIEIRAKSQSFPNTNDALLKLIDCYNITIIGNHSTMRMNKEEYTNGEWRHVIRLLGCRNISISDLVLRDSGGDGIAVGRSKSSWFSENIKLSNLQCINNKRQGISITSAQNVWVTDSCFIDTKGTAPGAGLDIEADQKEERMVNINFTNCEFKNNYYAGINIGLPKLTSESKEISIVFSECLISNNFSEENENVAAEIIIRSNKTNPVKGSVIFNKCVIADSKWMVLYARKNVDGFNVTFKDCLAKNICEDKSCSSAFYFEVPHYLEAASFGGFHFENFTLGYSNERPVMTVRGSRLAIYNSFRNATGKISFNNPNETIEEKITYINYLPNFNKNVSLAITKDLKK